MKNLAVKRQQKSGAVVKEQYAQKQKENAILQKNVRTVPPNVKLQIKKSAAAQILKTACAVKRQNLAVNQQQTNGAARRKLHAEKPLMNALARESALTGPLVMLTTKKHVAVQMKSPVCVAKIRNYVATLALRNGAVKKVKSVVIIGNALQKENAVIIKRHAMKIIMNNVVVLVCITAHAVKMVKAVAK